MSLERSRRDYEGDVIFDVWRSGGNPDAVDLDAVRDHYDAGDYPESAAAAELRRMQRRRSEDDEAATP